MRLANIALYFEIDLIALAVVLVVLFYGWSTGAHRLEKKAFRTITLLCLLMVSTDIPLWLLDGARFPGARIVLQTAMLLFGISTVGIGGAWLMYCDARVIKDGNRRLRYILYTLPTIAGTIAALIGLRYGWFYYYDEQNVYHRGAAYLLNLSFVLIQIAGSGLMIIRRGRRMNRVERQDAHSLMFFLVPPLVAIIIQSMFYGMSLIPVGITISLLIAFVQRQGALITIDSLTGLNNGRAFEHYMERWFLEDSPDRLLYVAIVNADNFKAINTAFGHRAGDSALVRIGYVIRNACLRQDFVARISGDEFVVAGHRKDTYAIEALVRSIHRAVDSENKTGENPFELALSVGYAVYDPKVHKTLDELVSAADMEMYKAKALRHERIF